jgi:hypothetical protein
MAWRFNPQRTSPLLLNLEGNCRGFPRALKPKDAATKRPLFTAQLAGLPLDSAIPV